jgi:hypothetical protein
LNLSLKYDYSADTVSIIDKEGTVVAETENIIKKTGIDLSPAIYLSISSFIIILACFTISKKFKLFEQI